MPSLIENEKQEPITEPELGPFLLWFFTHTGHAEHVNTWRKAAAALKAASRKADEGKRG